MANLNGFAIAGEVIEKLSGLTYEEYLEDRILNPLNLHHTYTKSYSPTAEKFAKPYAALDDTSLYPLDPPTIEDGKIMVSVQGVQSSVDDLLTFSYSLIEARKGEPSPLENVAKQFSGHIFRSDSSLDKSYGLGLMRNLLPGTIGGGCNAMFAKLPTITPSGDSRLVVSHGGSQAGYTSFVTMLPDADVSFVVLVNSVGLSDPAGWVNELLLETILDSPDPSDFVQLAKDAVKNHISKFPAMEKDLEESRVSNRPSKPLKSYVGKFWIYEHDFLVEIRLKDPQILQVDFQGLDSQLWEMRHYQDDTFLWLTSRDEQAKRGRFTYSPSSVYKIIFSVNGEGSITGLSWPHDPGLSVEEQWFERGEFRQNDAETKLGKQR
ncbi:uncharacterized protein KY384_003103 [Bacidia gigantensis]|uniref:uncharacterized protein n=1 Tax=Bacidia gigantensis TaxID=2732470 RepID=UPI001D0439AF|nr:uncharacterized protein KY384_003103 [Bacidia gigantensis]KAG8531474.1 hypothetical protein KY384_003103 [Bacidia gigantensis]